MNVHSGAVIPTSCVAGGANKGGKRRANCVVYSPEAKLHYRLARGCITAGGCITARG